MQHITGVKVNLICPLVKLKYNLILIKTKLISKVIDGKFPDYSKVIPKENKKNLMVDRKEFIDSIEKSYFSILRQKGGSKA